MAAELLISEEFCEGRSQTVSLSKGAGLVTLTSHRTGRVDVVKGESSSASTSDDDSGSSEDRIRMDLNRAMRAGLPLPRPKSLPALLLPNAPFLLHLHASPTNPLPPSRLPRLPTPGKRARRHHRRGALSLLARKKTACIAIASSTAHGTWVVALEAHAGRSASLSPSSSPDSISPF